MKLERQGHEDTANMLLDLTQSTLDVRHMLTRATDIEDHASSSEVFSSSYQAGLVVSYNPNSSKIVTIQ